MQELLNNSDYEIATRYIWVLQGVVDSYSLATSESDRLQQAKQVYKQSLVKTLASKHKKSCSQDYPLYASNSILVSRYDSEGPERRTKKTARVEIRSQTYSLH